MAQQNSANISFDKEVHDLKVTVADTGIKYNRLEIKEKIMTDLGLSLTERRVNLEEADIIDTIMKLNSQELAYKASLSSTARIMKLSLADYL